MIKFDTALRSFDVIEVLAEDERVRFRFFHTAKVSREDSEFRLAQDAQRNAAGIPESLSFSQFAAERRFRFRN